MLYFHDPIIPKSDELDDIAKHHIIDLITEYIRNLLKHTCAVAGVPFSEDVLKADLRDCEFLDDMILPKDYTRKEKIRTLAGLYSLLIADEEYIPTLEMEYALANIIESMIEIEDGDLRLYSKRIPALTRRRMEDTISSVMNDIFEDFYDAVEGLSLEIDDQTPEDVIRQITSGYIEMIEKPCYEWINIYCFSDMSFTLLDEIDINRLRQSRFNMYEDIVPDDEEDDEYYLPDDWLTSRDFCFVNEYV